MNIEVSKIIQKIEAVEETGFAAGLEAYGFKLINKDVVFPYIIMTLCTRGSARALYDMQELTQSKNELGLIMPGHIMRPLECSEDYTYAWFIISPKMISDVFSDEDRSRFDKMPMCKLTEEQTKRLLMSIDQLLYISSFSEEKVPHRYIMLKAQLTVGYELLVHYRKSQDPEWPKDNYATLYSRFCDLVVENYTVSRNVNFYAERIGYEARYFSKLFKKISNGISPLEWIGRYVTAQAKRIMYIHPQLSIREVAIRLGFPNTANFCRFFKRVTGITPQEYKKMTADNK